MLRIRKLLSAQVTTRQTDFRLAKTVFSLSAIILFLAGIRVLTRLDLTDVQLLFGLLLVSIAALNCTLISLRFAASEAD